MAVANRVGRHFAERFVEVADEFLRAHQRNDVAVLQAIEHLGILKIRHANPERLSEFHLSVQSLLALIQPGRAPPAPGQLSSFSLAVDADRMQLDVFLPTNEVRRIEASQGPIYGVAVSADGRKVAAGGADGAVRLWEGNPGRVERKL